MQPNSIHHLLRQVRNHIKSNIPRHLSLPTQRHSQSKLPRHNYLPHQNTTPTGPQTLTNINLYPTNHQRTPQNSHKYQHPTSHPKQSIITLSTKLQRRPNPNRRLTTPRNTQRSTIINPRQAQKKNPQNHQVPNTNTHNHSQSQPNPTQKAR